MFFEWDSCLFNGRLLQVSPLNYSDITSLKKVFSQDLFEYYPSCFSSCEEFVNKKIIEKEKKIYYPWVFIEKESGECIGTSSFSNISFEHKRLEIGFTWFGKEKQKLGFNVESKLLLLEYLFEKAGFTRVEFKTDELNISSNLAMQKLGFTKEGVFRKHLIMPSGRYRNSVYYSVIDEDWQQVKEIILNRLQKKQIMMNTK
ncbi:GNAT family N-acetyltransferase [Silvanigrella paludirubra]|uniref:GNAT family N-acetyltransferase n=1 Tax=Silvanigrella paludirubra TaxID=2499159 RepID=A0A6N6VV21_9BACT|nr:GNAT family protein [Silvanigrella paludirubra]KAB8038041.1 GNAT family N-acetyltransferase [Silvanigrella paludirubra]